MIWRRIIYLRDSSALDAASQLKELEGYLGKIDHCPPVNDSVNSMLLLRTGALHSFIKDFKTAIALTKRGIGMIQTQKNNPAISEAQLIKGYNNLCYYYDSTGQKTLVQMAADSCISISLRLNKMYELATPHLAKKIEFLFGKGEYYHCLELALIGEEISRKTGSHLEDVFYYASWEINSLIFLKRFSEASDKLGKAVAECYQSKNKTNLGSLLNLKATLAVKGGSAPDAVNFTYQSFNYEKKAGNFRNCAAALNNLGYDFYYKRLSENDRALYYFHEALKYAGLNDSLSILNNIANIYVDKKDFHSAFDIYSSAFNLVHENSDERFLLNGVTSTISVNWKMEYLITLVLDKAEAYIKRYLLTKNPADLRTSLEVFRTADRLMDKIKIAQSELSSKLFWRSQNRRLYERAIEACYLSGNMENAFYFFEKSRAVLLNDQLKQQETADPKMTEIAAIRKKLFAMDNQLALTNPASTAFADLQRQIFASKEQLNEIDLQLKDRNPWYYQSLIDTNFISLQEVKTKLIENKNDQSVLEFFNGDSAIYLLTITKNQTSITRINKVEFESKVDKYNGYLSDPAIENSDHENFITTGQQLYRLIFRDSPLPEGRVIVSPDGKYFPLETLITTRNISDPIYFLNNHIVSYTYSVRFLLNDFSLSSVLTKGHFLGVAPVQYPSQFNLASLSQSDVSLKTIGAYFGTPKILVATEASKTNFMNQFYGYKIIQLYTHATDSGANGEPVIYFADSSLSLPELIPENKPATQLIVLSACETGNGKLYKGEGVFSFNRGFAALGIPSSIINLWSVENESTYKITELFYKYTSQGLPLDVALQKAKLEFIGQASKQKKLPYYWAAAILVGKTDAIEMSKPIQWTWIAIAAGISVAVILFLLFKRKNKTRIS